MRLIDADKLETHEQLVPLRNGKYEYVEVVYKDDIDDAPTIELQKWTPCSKKLPKKKSEVIGYVLKLVTNVNVDGQTICMDWARQILVNGDGTLWTNHSIP